MMKKIGSVLLCCAILFVSVVTTRNPFVQTTQAAVIGEKDSNGLIVEPARQTYSETDPEQIMLFTTTKLENYNKGLTTHWVLTAAGTSTKAISGSGSCYFQNAKGNTTGLNMEMIRTDGGHGEDPLTEEQAVMTTWGVQRMVGFSTDETTQIASDSTYKYFYNLRVDFGQDIDLTKMTHIYFDFWIAGKYTTGKPGGLLLEFYDNDNGSSSTSNGYREIITFSELRQDNGTACTQHALYLDIRDWTTEINVNGTMKLNSIDGVTIRSVVPSSDAYQVDTYGGSPRIFFGQMFAFTRQDNLQLWHQFNDTTKDSNQGIMHSVVGHNRWNANVNIKYPGWIGKTSGSVIVGLYVGDQGTGKDYYINALDRSAWRWRRSGATAATYNLGISFPNNALYSTGGGNQSLVVTRNNTRYITANDVKEYYVK